MRVDDVTASERRAVADANLQMALTDLTEASARHLRQLVRSVEDDVIASIHSISDAAVDGLQDIKAEISISAAVRRNPIPWVLGAAIAGGVAGFLVRKEPTGKESISHIN